MKDLKNEFQILKNNLKSVLSSFGEIKMQLISFSFYGKEIFCRTWDELYVYFLETLLSKYPYYMNYLYENQESISLCKICTYDEIENLKRPVHVRGSELYVETELSSLNMLKAISRYSENLGILDDITINYIEITEDYIPEKTYFYIPKDTIFQDGNSFIAFLKKSNTEYVDNRNKDGCFWIRGGKELNPLIQHCKKDLGIIFQFKNCSTALNGNDGWWTKSEFLYHSGAEELSKRVDFNSKISYDNTVPVYAKIKGSRIIKSIYWKTIYVEVIKFVVRYHRSYVDDLVTKGILFNVIRHNNSLECIGNDLYVNTNLSPNEIIENIRKTFEICDLSTSDIIIEYLLTEEDIQKENEDTTAIDIKKEKVSEVPTDKRIDCDSENIKECELIEFNLSASKNVHLYTPVYYSYKAFRKYVSTWKELYVGVISCLAHDHYSSISSWAGMGDIFKSGKTLSSRTYSVIAKDLYVYTDIYVFQMIEKITKYFHVCDENESLLKIFCHSDSGKAGANKKNKEKSTSVSNPKIEEKKLISTEKFYNSFLNTVKSKCKINIGLFSELAKKAIEISEHDIAVTLFSDCHKTIADSKEAINTSITIADRVKQDNYLYSKLSELEIYDIGQLLEKLESFIQDEKNSANAVIDSDDWDEAERVMNNARSNIKVIRQLIAELTELNKKINVPEKSI